MKTNWQTKKLGDLYEITSSKRVFKSEWKESGVAFYRAREIVKLSQQGFVNNELYISEDMYKQYKIKYGVPKEDDIMVTGVGTLGICYVVKKNDKFYFKDGNIIWLKRKSDINSRFIEYAFKSDLLREQIDGGAGATVGTYTIIKAKNTIIPFPPFSEQLRIVKILDEVFEKIERAKENSEKNLKNTKELFESYLQSVFANLEKGWEEKNLGDICEMINRGVSPKYIESKGLCVLNQKCIRDHKINFDLSRLHDLKKKKVSNNKFIQVGDVLVNSTGTGTLGRIAQVRELSTEATVDSHITIVRPIKNMFYNDFFGYALIFIEKEIAKRGEGCGGQTELARNTLKNDFIISYPKSLSEQKSIVAKLDALSEETKKLEAIYKQKLADLEELKKSVLKKAFAGEL